MNKLVLSLFVFVGCNNYAMRPPIYLGQWQNKTIDDIVLSFESGQKNITITLPAEQSTSVALNKGIAFEQSTPTSSMAVVGIDKVAARDDDRYKKMSVLLVLALSEEMKVFTSVVLRPVKMSEKASTFLNLVETPAPLGINFDAVIEDSETVFTATIKS